MNWGGGGGGGSTTIIYNHNTYINNHVWNNRNYNGYHPWGGGAAGSQNHAWYSANGTFHPDGNYKPGEDTHYGPNGGYHPNGYFGPQGGWHPDVPGTGPAHMPNGGNNGNHGLIGGNGGVQNPPAGATQSALGGRPNGGNQLLAQNRNDNNHHVGGAEQNRSRFSGDGVANRAESNRGWGSMAGRRPQRMPNQRPPTRGRSFGGGRRR